MFDANKLLNQMLGAGGASQGQGAMGQMGGLLGSLLQQSVSGLQDGAAAIEKQTGVAAKANSALQGATGKSAGDLLKQAQQIIGQNKMASGAALGGLGALLLGTRGGRGLVGNAAALGGLALVGGLAYKAWQNHQAGKAPTPQPAAQIEAAPAAAPFGETGNASEDNATSLLIIRAMIAAAACDGAIDNEERSRIVGGLQEAGLDTAAAKFLDDEFAHPASIDDLNNACTTPELALQVYTAARIAIEPESMKEKAFLMNLAVALNLSDAQVAHVDAMAQGAAG
jgi:uncharacterized membrane protein YebE (DUF533 family)